MLARKALAGTAGAPKEYVEDVFSTYLYTGTGSNQTITNNIDISGEGGLVWIKGRSPTSSNNTLYDTERGAGIRLRSNLTNAQSTNLSGYDLTSFTSSGFTLGTAQDTGVNSNGDTSVSWTFRKAKKFFDVVTFTTTTEPTSPRTVSHNLGSTPGFVLLKNTTSGADWYCYHRSLGDNSYLVLNATQASSSLTGAWSVSSTNITIKENFLAANSTFVAYLFAHDAGGFGDAGSDNVITCGSFTSSASGGATVTLNYEAQWVLLKNTSSAENWILVDTMRGMSFSATPFLKPNLSDAEGSLGAGAVVPTATGFTVANGVLSNSNTYIYIAIRRGPMKTPTSGTSVFAVTSFTGVDAAQTSNFPVDFVMNSENLTGTVGWFWVDRLRGATKKLESNATNAEGSVSSGDWDSNTTVKISGSGNSYKRSYPMFRRAPGFFDVVCYTGTGSNLTVAHNLGVTPELIIAKNRTTAGNNWPVLFNFTSTNSSYAFLNLTSAGGNDTYANVGVMTAQPTSTNLYLSSSGSMNTSTNGHVAYLFASVSGVSKVGTYTGNGSSVTVTTDFQPRFIMVKRTDSTGNWIVGDSARGLVAGNDPYLLLNSTAAEDTDEDWVDITSTSFTVNQTTAANANVNTGTYIYLAIS